MSYPNPTGLRVGATGTLGGRRYRVAGRTVMGMEQGGEIYPWNEFHLVDGFGRSATLVYEETDDGPEWKLFQVHEPLRALTVREASTKRVGDVVNLDGTPRKITLVDQSRVYAIEGTAPDGVQVDDVANYFNVDTGSRMLVASWTGDEMEFYEGEDVTAEQVSAAFSLSTAGAAAPLFSNSPASFRATPPSSSKKYLWLVGAVLTAAVFFAAYSCAKSRSEDARAAAPAPRRAAPAVRLATGTRTTLAGQTYAVNAHAEVGFARTSGRQDAREYTLRQENGEAAVLLHGLTTNGQEWLLLKPVTSASPLDPFDAAAKRRNSPVSINGRSVFVREMFAAKRIGGAPAGVQYGFLASEGATWILARWDEAGSQLYHATTLRDSDVVAGVAQK